jgi:hypothetical protein
MTRESNRDECGCGRSTCDDCVAYDPESQAAMPLPPRDRRRVAPRITGALLEASAGGWGMTIRYALLLLVHRGTVGVAIWMALEAAQWAGLN